MYVLSFLLLLVRSLSQELSVTSRQATVWHVAGGGVVLPGGAAVAALPQQTEEPATRYVISFKGRISHLIF